MTKTITASLLVAAGLGVAGVLVALGGVQPSTLATAEDSNPPAAAADGSDSIDEIITTGEAFFAAETSGGDTVESHPQGEQFSTLEVRNPEGDVEFEADRVTGIAIADQKSTLTAWTQDITDSQRQLVVFNTTTGEKIAATDVPSRSIVMAVYRKTVVLSDGQHTMAWNPVTGLQRLAYLPNRFYATDVDDQYVLASDLNTVTNVYNRATGEIVGTIPNLISGTFNDVEQIAGATAGGDPLVATTSGEVLATPKAKNVIAVNWLDNGDLALISQDQNELEFYLSICPSPFETCNVPDLEPGETPVLPAEGFTQLIATAS